jgi:1-aminocyclopropane-1-carboxylate deaminase
MGNYQASKINEIQKHFGLQVDPHLLYHSRVHPSRQLGSHVFIKREDESGFGMSGSKRRKFASLLPALHAQQIRRVVLIGSARSNHVIALSQLLLEQGIEPYFLLKQNHQPEPQGNSLLLGLLAKPERIRYLDREAWKERDGHAREWVDKLGPGATFVPEGGFCREALPGACTLLPDIIENEKQQGLTFEQVWVDAGTGLTAAALILMSVNMREKRHIHVVLMAEDEAAFLKRYQQCARWFFHSESMPPFPQDRVSFHYPPTARSFGSVNRKVMEEVVSLARTEGLLCDPVYTAKLFLTARHYFSLHPPQQPHLILHGGGGTGLFGFGEKLQAVL